MVVENTVGGGWHDSPFGDEGYESDSSDGFWSGRLRSVRVDSSGEAVVGLGDPDGQWQYKNPAVKTFAWWWAAVQNEERREWLTTPGWVEELDSDSDGEAEEVGGRTLSVDADVGVQRLWAALVEEEGRVSGQQMTTSRWS